MDEGWSLRVALPHPRLRAAVAAYVGFRERGASDGPRLEVPSPTLPLILSLRAGMEVDGRSRGSFLAGPHDVPSLVGHAGDQDGIEVQLTPTGARRLLGRPLAGLAGEVVDVGDVLGRAGDELVERLREADWGGRVALLDRHLLARWEAAAPVAAELEQAWELLRTSGGGVRVDELATEVGWSRRHLAGRMREELGLSPSVLRRVVRFSRARRLVLGGTDLADAAYACGYADQPHLNRDFRAFTGTTPTAYLAAQVPSVQDGGPRVT